MRGYALLEIVIYVAILAVIAVLVVGSVLSVYQAFVKMRVERKLALNGDVAMETLIRDIRAASGYDTGVSVFGASPGVLKINAQNSTEKFFLSGTVLQTQKGAAPAENLTSSDVKVASLIFYATSTVNSKMVTIRMSLQAGGGVFQKTKNFYGSAVMRGVY